MAFDGRKNLYVPEPGLPFGYKLDTTVKLPDPRASRIKRSEEFRYFSLVITQVATVDLSAVLRFCEGDRNALAIPEAILTGIQALNVLMV